MEDREHTYLAAIGGVGSGKTSFIYPWHHDRCLINHKSLNSLIVAENGKYLKLRFKGYCDYLESIGYREKRHYWLSRSSPYTVRYWFGHEVLFWSAETKIVSLNISHDSQDEPALFAQETAFEIDQRRRCPDAVLLQSLSASSPEGMNWFYDHFGVNVKREGRYSVSADKLVLHSSTHDNFFLPDGYIETLEARFGWDKAYFDNYVMGLWVNLARNAFYFSFTEDNIERIELDARFPRMYWTLDNNVGKMQWVAAQERDGVYNVFAANKGTARNLQEVANELLAAFPPGEYGRWQIEVAGDAVLHHRSPQSHTTGYELLSKLLKPHYPNLKIIAHRQNPLVAERSFVSNQMLAEGRLAINPDCGRVIHSVRATQSDGKGGIIKPSKDEVTHAMEAVDHLLTKLCPIKIGGVARVITW